MVAPKSIVESYRDLPEDAREAIGLFWRTLMMQNAGTPWENLCHAWVLMIDGDAAGAEIALHRVIEADDVTAAAQARTALALLHEGDEAASYEYERAAVDPSATFAKYKHAERLIHECRYHEAEAVLRAALEHADAGDIPGLQFIVGEYIHVLVELGRRDEAVDLLTEMARKYPDDLAFRRQLAEISNK